MWAPLSDEELLKTSDLVVLGEWAGQAQITSSGQTVGRDVGVILAKEIYRGPPTLTIVLVSVPQTGGPRSSEDIVYARGASGLWFLRKYPGGPVDLYAADHPMRFIDSKTGHTRIADWQRRLKR